MNIKFSMNNKAIDLKKNFFKLINKKFEKYIKS